MFHFGGANVPGAPGNLLAGGPSFDINRRSGALGGRSGEQLKRLYEGGTQQNEQLNKELIERGIMPRGGPKLPLVQNGAFGGAAGNMGGMLAQTNPMDPSYHAMPNSAEAVHARTFGVRNWNLGS